jgi:hypothetical protein
MLATIETIAIAISHVRLRPVPEARIRAPAGRYPLV